MIHFRRTSGLRLGPFSSPVSRRMSGVASPMVTIEKYDI